MLLKYLDVKIILDIPSRRLCASNFHAWERFITNIILRRNRGKTCGQAKTICFRKRPGRRYRHNHRRRLLVLS